ncbi:hypothetical protein B0181_04570 [Moraxella caviae]|uniref:Transcriptional regulator BetI n=2 Tax=Moraxella caviae TaxID=34060 RepID=A0A1T0A536_9GAMM|nr:hypothetical protein B0181_04570 [Moraxella caviae]STZ14842.1 transcriptional regulator BetI [Moraxella caviae]VEW11265.1 transcriptional regulator BetI [Moraxella caviae]
MQNDLFAPTADLPQIASENDTDKTTNLQNPSQAKRKNNPELLRHTLLIAAKDCLLEHGTAQFSMQKVADRAGVSKGGLFHHFKSKDELMAGVVTLFIAQINTAILEQIAQNAQGNPSHFAAFTRAYVQVFCGNAAIGLASDWAGLIRPMNADSTLGAHWQAWLDSKLRQHHATDHDLRLLVVRRAIDGLWLGGAATDDLPSIERYLLEMIDELQAEL